MSSAKVSKHRNEAGFDQDRFTATSRQLEEFLCGICHGIFYNPVVTECCTTTYCRFCIKTWLKNNKRCPNDRKGLTSSGLNKASNAFRNLLSNLNIKCEYESEGCAVQVKLCDLDKHQDSCEFRPNNKCKRCGIQKENDHTCLASLLAAKKEWEEERVKMCNAKEKTDNEMKKLILEFTKETKVRLNEFEKRILEKISTDKKKENNDHDNSSDEEDSDMSSYIDSDTSEASSDSS